MAQHPYDKLVDLMFYIHKIEQAMINDPTYAELYPMVLNIQDRIDDIHAEAEVHQH